MLNNKILVVDDIPENLHLLSNILQNNGFNVFASKNAKKAFEIIENNDINLILLDIFMPEIDGFEIATKLKNSETTKDIPIIFLTAHSDPDLITKGFEIGGQDYIIKPFNSAELIARISTHLELANARKELKKNLETNLLLLNQYKQVVDKSSIVSKTDRKGIITYVNDAFIDISGYTREELIGKSHNIVRHPDMSKKEFKNMWSTLISKNVWQGEVKNRNKNGEAYIVRSTIMPILNASGDIEEFISVRHDITEIYQLHEEIEDTQKEVVFTMGAIGETRSKETGNHVKRVAEYSRLLGKYYGLKDKELEMLAQASPMHDIGKVGIPDNILNKPGRLTKEEFQIMKTHAELGYQMLCHSTRPLLKVAATIALEHHERWDGKGYPKGLEKEEISIYGRITAIADVFDALGSDRIYKKAWEDEKVFNLLRREKGTHFDPKLIDIFFEHLDEFLIIRETFKDV